MAPKTFAQGWATLAAMDRPSDHGGVVVEWPDDRMLSEELEWLLPVGLPRDQLSQQPQAIALVGEGYFAGSFEFCTGVLPGEREESLHHPMAFDAPGIDDGLGPGMRLGSDRPDLAQQIGDAAFKAVDLRGVEVLGVGAVAALIPLGMDRDLLHPVVEHPDAAAVPANPDLPAEVFGGHRVERLGDLDMAVAADLSLGLTEVLEAVRWQRQEGCPFRFVEVGQHLLLRGPVNPGVGCASFPLLEMLVLGVEAGERPPFEGVLGFVGSTVVP